MKPESVQKVAQAIVGQMPVIQDVTTHINPATMERSFTLHSLSGLAVFEQYGEAMAQAAIRAVMQSDEVRGLVEATRAYLKEMEMAFSPEKLAVFYARDKNLRGMIKALAALEAEHVPNT